MSEYLLEIKQIVDYPRCRIYRQFIQTLLNDRGIRASGGSGLFHYTVLCSYTNFRTSYHRIDGISYTVYPGEWVCSLKELSQWFRTRFQHEALKILDSLQAKHLIEYILLNRGRIVKYKIRDWIKHNTVLDYNCPCQKDSGFFFMPYVTAMELLSTGKASEMDVVLDLWLSAIYNDAQVYGSDLGPVAYFRNGTGSPITSYGDLSRRWGMSKPTVGRLLKKLVHINYISLMTFPGRTGSVIYLQNYLSTMFQISDVSIDKEEVAMVLHIPISLPEDRQQQTAKPVEHEVSVSDALCSVSEQHIGAIIQEVSKVLAVQGISCFNCPKSTYKLLPLSDDCWEVILPWNLDEKAIRFKLQICCGSDKILYTFALTFSPTDDSYSWRF